MYDIILILKLKVKVTKKIHFQEEFSLENVCYLNLQLNDAYPLGISIFLSILTSGSLYGFQNCMLPWLATLGTCIGCPRSTAAKLQKE